MIIEIFDFIFDAVILAIYFKKMLGKKRTSISFPLYALAFILCEICIFFLSIYFDNTYNNYRLCITIIISLFTTFSLTFLHKTSFRHRLFVSISFQIYATISELLVFILFSCLPEKTSMVLLENAEYGSVCSKIILFILLNVTILLWHRKKVIYSLQYSILVLTMPILSIILLITIPIQNTSDATQSAMNIAGMSGILIANIVNYFLLDNALKVQELQQISIQQKRQLDYQAAKYQQISTIYRNSRKLIHDTKKHFFFLSNCVKNNEIPVIIPYIQKAMDDIEQSHNRVNTGNLVIDAFVSNHMSIAEQENISFQSNIQIATMNVAIHDYDLSIILGNLLDNALNACRKIQIPAPRQIETEIFTTNMEFVIHIANTIPASVNLAIDDSSDELKHGFGTRNVAAIVERYLGTYTYYCEEEHYHCIVSIPCHISKK